MAILKEHSIEHDDDTLMSLEISLKSREIVDEDRDKWINYELCLRKGSDTFSTAAGNVMFSEIEDFNEEVAKDEGASILLEPEEPDFSLRVDNSEYETVVTIFVNQGRPRAGFYDSSAVGMKFVADKDQLKHFFTTLLDEARSLYESDDA